MQYRKKPVQVEAHRWMQHDDPVTGALGNDHMANWLGSVYDGISSGQLHIATLEGRMTASYGDYIVKGIAGEFYPVKPAIFEATYEPVSTDLKRDKTP